jgi:hypothetical protein
MSEPMVTITLSEYEKLTKATITDMTAAQRDKISSFILDSALVCRDYLEEFVTWKETPQGHSYWDTVHRNLSEMIEENS